MGVIVFFGAFLLAVSLFVLYGRWRVIPHALMAGGACAAIYFLMELALPKALANGVLYEDVEWFLSFFLEDYTAFNIAISPILSFLCHLPVFVMIATYPMHRITGRPWSGSLWLCVVFYLPMAIQPVYHAL